MCSKNQTESHSPRLSPHSFTRERSSELSQLRHRHKWLVSLLLVLFTSLLVAAKKPLKTPDSLSSLQQIRRFHRRVPLIDLHADTMYRQMKHWLNLRKPQRWRDLDLPKLRRGGVGAQVFVLWIDPRKTKRPGDGWRALLRMYRGYKRLLKESRGRLVHARTAQDVRRIVKQGKIAALLAIEGLHPLEGRPYRVQTIARWGLVYAGLTWNNSNAFASSATQESKGQGRKGLTARGRKVVRLLERHRILVDVSHLGPRAFWDVIKLARRPVIASHSNAKSVCSHVRNLTPRQIRAIAKTGGVIGVNFYPRFLRQGRHWRRASIRDILKHIKALARVGGWKTVALGSDFDGIPRGPRGLRHVGQLPSLTRALLKAGIKGKRLRGLLGHNVLRLLPP